jgi:GTP cyclohydrolase I
VTVQGSRFTAYKQEQPSLQDVEAAFRTIIRWTGDDPLRPGLLETPSRAARAFKEYFAGYDQDPIDILNKTFDETGGYEEMVILRGISFESHCEHHLAPIVGQAWVFRMAASSVCQSWRALSTPMRSGCKFRSE